MITGVKSSSTTPTLSKGSVLLVATLAAFVTPFMGSSINIALPLIGQEFDMDAITLGWISTSYLLALSIFLVPFGRIADIYGRKRIFTWGIIVYTISSLLTGLATSTNLLIVFRILQGISGAMCFGTVVAILTSVFLPGERGRALGINVASVYSGLSLGPVLGGLIVEHLGWRSIFFINAAMGLVIIAITLAKLRGEWSEAKGEKFDYVGSIVYGVALAALMLGFSSLRGRCQFVVGNGWHCVADSLHLDGVTNEKSGAQCEHVPAQYRFHAF